MDFVMRKQWSRERGGAETPAGSSASTRKGGTGSGSTGAWSTTVTIHADYKARSDAMKASGGGVPSATTNGNV